MFRLCMLFAALLLAAAPARAQSVSVDVFEVQPVVLQEVAPQPITADVFSVSADPTCYPPATAMPVSISVDVFAAQPPKLEPIAAGSLRYPVRTGHWTGPFNNKASLVQHLSTGKHAGKFDLAWLASLSYPELQSLHDDDHENCIDRTAVKWAAPPAVYQPPRQQQQSCRTVWTPFGWRTFCR